MKLGEAMYKAQQGESEGGDSAGAEAGASEQPSGNAEEEVVDAEFSEVDEDQKG